MENLNYNGTSNDEKSVYTKDSKFQQILFEKIMDNFVKNKNVQNDDDNDDSSDNNNNNECLIWKNKLVKKACIIKYKNKCYNVTKFLWEYYGNDPIKPTEQFVRTCGNNLCNLISHINVIPKKHELDINDIKQYIENAIKNKSNVLENGCIVLKSNNDSKYSIVKINSVSNLLHRYAYIAYKNNNQLEIPSKDKHGNILVIRHLCNNPPCFNPDHLKLGTQSQNCYNDRIKHGTHINGEKSYQSALTNKNAELIKQMIFPKGHKYHLSTKFLAELFEVSRHVIKRIGKGDTYLEIQNDTTNNEAIRKINRDHVNEKKKEQWTEEMFDEARQQILEKSKLSKTILSTDVKSKCLLFNSSNSTKSSEEKLNVKNNYHNYRMWCHGKQMYVQVMMCEAKYGRHKQKNEYIRKLCGISNCVNEEHLEFCSDKVQKAQDRVKRGKNTLCKIINENTIRLIRKLYNEDNITPKKIIKYLLDNSIVDSKNGLSERNILSIATYKTWKHVSD